MMADQSQQQSKPPIRLTVPTPDSVANPNVETRPGKLSKWVDDLRELSYSTSGKEYEFLIFRFTLRADVSSFSLDDILNPPPDGIEYPVPRIDSLSVSWRLLD